MYILGIETSCDETSAAVVKDGRLVLSNTVISSLKEHAKYGGIIPEIASRRQMECIKSIVAAALDQANVGLDDIDAIAVTEKPGLIGSLLVGISFARALSFATKKPLIEVDHIKAHLYAPLLTSDPKAGTFKPIPAIGLVVSGGHSSLYYIKNWKNFELLGQTRDDAVGESYDKVARVLGLGYPGGPIIDKLAQKKKISPLRFKCADMPGSLDFSFSGIKTAVLYYHRDNHQKSDFSNEKICHAFQESVISIIVNKTIAACNKTKTKVVLVGGGVAANSALREKLAEQAKENNLNVYFPEFKYCLDNAAMIAGIGFQWKS